MSTFSPDVHLVSIKQRAKLITCQREGAPLIQLYIDRWQTLCENKTVVEGAEFVHNHVSAKRKKELYGITASSLRTAYFKHKHVVKPGKYKEFSENEINFARKMVYEKAITVIKNEGDLLPIQRFDKKIAHVSIGAHTEALQNSMDQISKVDHFHFYNGEEAVRRFKHRLADYDVIITSIHSKSVIARGDYGLPKGWRGWVKTLPGEKENILVLFGNPYALGKDLDLSLPLKIY